MLRIDILSFCYQFGIFSKCLGGFLFAYRVFMQFISLCRFCFLIQVLIFCIYFRSVRRPNVVDNQGQALAAPYLGRSKVHGGQRYRTIHVSLRHDNSCVEVHLSYPHGAGCILEGKA